MLLLFSGSAIDGFYQYQYTSDLGVTNIIVYTFTLLIALSVTSFGVRVSLSLRFYHPNVNRLYTFGLLMWILLCISKACIFVFQLRGYNKTAYHDPIDEVPGIFLLKVSGFCRYFYFFFGSATPLAATVERAFATILLADYEKSSRTIVSFIITVINVCLALTFTILVVFFHLQTIIVIIIISSYLIICFLLVTFLYRYNIRRIRRLDRYHRDTQYTLSKRFQLRENIKILRLIMKMIYAVVLFISLLVIGLTLPVLLSFDQWTKTPIRHFVDVCLHCNPLIIITMTIIFIPEFKKNAKLALSHRVQMARSSVDSQYNAYKVGQKEADVYFDQFKRAMSSSNESAFMKRSV